MIIVRGKRSFIYEILKLGLAVRSWLEAHRVLLMRLVMIVGLLFIAPIIGILVVQRDPLLVLGATILPIALVAFQLLLPRFELYPLIILFAAIFIPIELPTGTESRLVDSFLLTFLFVGNWVFKMILVDKRFHIKPLPVNKPLLGFMFVVLFSVVWSMVFRDPLVDVTNLSKRFVFVQIASALTMIMLPGAFLLVANHINNVRLLKIMVGMMLVAGVIAVFERYIVGYRLVAINDSGLFTMWIAILGVGLGLFNREWSWKWRAALLVLGTAAFFFRFTEQITWLAGWLPSVIALGVVLFRRSKKLFLLVLVAGIIFISINADYYLGQVVEDETNESGHTRMAAWEVNWRITANHLLFGTGPAGYAAYYMSYFPDDAMATHNNMIDILAQTGIVGFGLCMAFFFGLVGYGYKLCRRLTGRDDFLSGLANVAFAGTVSCTIMMFFGDWLFPFTYTQTIAGFDYIVYSWLFMGMLPVIDRLTQPEPMVVEHA
ncbi:MAG: O-antigen ligase family protein [Chloroflexi bacterium]|nr:O-antigen ligase family protein [Chloroflexota bacterium]